MPQANVAGTNQSRKNKVEQMQTKSSWWFRESKLIGMAVGYGFGAGGISAGLWTIYVAMRSLIEWWKVHNGFPPFSVIFIGAGVLMVFGCGAMLLAARRMSITPLETAVCLAIGIGMSYGAVSALNSIPGLV